MKQTSNQTLKEKYTSFLENKNIHLENFEPNKVLEKLKSKITYNRKLAFLVTLIVGLIVHFQVYANDIHTPDTLWNSSYHISGEWEVSLGRWRTKNNRFINGRSCIICNYNFCIYCVNGNNSNNTN